MHFKLHGRTHYLYQWDYGKQLMIGDTECDEVHLCHQNDDVAYVCKINDNNGMRVVNIPNKLLQTPGKVDVYTYIETENSGYTDLVWSFSVIARKQPADYVYTETEVFSYKNLEARVKSLEEKPDVDLTGYATEQYVDDAISSNTLVKSVNDVTPDANGNVAIEVANSTDAVQYIAQDLTDEQKLQARHNIDAAMEELVVTFSGQGTEDDPYQCDKTFDEIQTAIRDGRNVCGMADASMQYVEGNQSNLVTGKFDLTFYDPDVYIEFASITGNYFGTDCRTVGIHSDGTLYVDRHHSDSYTKPLIVTVTEDENGECVADTWYENIFSAHVEGREVRLYVKCASFPDGTIFTGSWFDPYLLEDGVFNKFALNDNTITEYRITISEESIGVVTLEAIPVEYLRDFPTATTETIGGIKADPAIETDTQPVRIGEDGKLYTEPVSGSGGIDLGITGASVGQIAKITAVDDNGVPTAWEPVEMPSGESEEVWELLADVTIEEDTSAFTETWADRPMRKVMINVGSLSASANTNYMPTTICTDDTAHLSFNVARFYPEALPRTAAENRTYIVEAFRIAETPVIKLTEYKKGIAPLGSKGYESVGAVSSATTPGNSPYAEAVYEQITGVKFQTYGTFVVGTKFSVYGVAK